MSYLSPISTHWTHAAHHSTNVSVRPSSPDHPRGVRPNNGTSTHEQQLRNDAIERSNRFNIRSSHLPYRGVYAQRHRLIRAMNGQPPVGSTIDADEVSDEEIASDNRVSVVEVLART